MKSNILKSVNLYRSINGKTARDKAPLTEAALRRYVNGGKSYPNGIPKLTKQAISAAI